MSEKASIDDALTATESTSIFRSNDDLALLTPARVALARTGNSITTRDTLAFARDHAQARDAVHARLSLPTLLHDLRGLGLDAIAVRSAASDRTTYLRRPDLGRTLSEASRTAMHADEGEGARRRLTIIVADGLSALAVDRNAIAVVETLLPLVQATWDLTAIVIAEQARVALGDEIGVALRAHLTVMLIGERPGLSAADSLGAYITWNPRIGCTNAERNCISNIRSEGLQPQAAAERIAYFLKQAVILGQTGTMLKDPDEQQGIVPAHLQSSERPPANESDRLR